MTQAQAERVANVVIGALVTTVLYYTLTQPTLRRMAWQMTRAAIAAAGPWAVSEARRAWAASGTRDPLSGTPVVVRETQPRGM